MAHIKIQCSHCEAKVIVEDSSATALAEVGDEIERSCPSCSTWTTLRVLAIAED